jgi:hypothetical protein
VREERGRRWCGDNVGPCWIWIGFARRLFAGEISGKAGHISFDVADADVAKGEVTVLCEEDLGCGSTRGRRGEKFTSGLDSTRGRGQERRRHNEPNGVV